MTIDLRILKSLCPAAGATRAMPTTLQVSGIRMPQVPLLFQKDDFHMLQIRWLGATEAFPELHEGFKSPCCGRREKVGVAAVWILSEIDAAVAGPAGVVVLLGEHFAKGGIDCGRVPRVIDVNAVPVHEPALLLMHSMRLGTIAAIAPMT